VALGRNRPRTPAGWRVLTDEPVHGLADKVGVPGVPAVLLDQVAHEAPKAGVAAVGPGNVNELVESAVGEGGAESRPRLFDGVIPEGIELCRGVGGGRGELPVGFGLPVDRVPRRAGRRPAELGAGVVLLDQREVLEQTAEGQRTGADAGLQPG
jgi:hypothetical protein